MSDEIKVLVERARRNAGWRNEKWQCITDPALLEELAARIEAMSAALTAQAEEIERLRKALRPFSRIADMEEMAEACASVIVNIDRCREARAALKAAQELLADAIQSGEHLKEGR